MLLSTQSKITAQNGRRATQNGEAKQKKGFARSGAHSLSSARSIMQCEHVQRVIHCPGLPLQAVPRFACLLSPPAPQSAPRLPLVATGELCKPLDSPLCTRKAGLQLQGPMRACLSCMSAGPTSLAAHRSLPLAHPLDQQATAPLHPLVCHWAQRTLALAAQAERASAVAPAVPVSAHCAR